MGMNLKTDERIKNAISEVMKEDFFREITTLRFVNNKWQKYNNDQMILFICRKVIGKFIDEIESEIKDKIKADEFQHATADIPKVVYGREGIMQVLHCKENKANNIMNNPKYQDAFLTPIGTRKRPCIVAKLFELMANKD